MESGGFSKAAQRLLLTQPAVSYQMRQLEDALGVKLFTRQPTGVAPTAAGDLMYRYAKQLVELAAEARERVTALDGEFPGSLRITCAMQNSILGVVTAERFKQLHPGVQVTLLEGSDAAVLVSLYRSQADLALLDERPSDIECGWAELLNDVIYAAVPSGHPYADATALTLPDLLGERLAVFPEGSRCRTYLGQRAAELGVTPKIAFESAQTSSILRAVGLGIGVALVPFALAMLSGFDDTLRFLPIDGDYPSIVYGLAWRSPEPLVGPIAEFVEMAPATALRALSRFPAWMAQYETGDWERPTPPAKTRKPRPEQKERTEPIPGNGNRR
jgi:DNA-binding transcriptional LysR family regulator